MILLLAAALMSMVILLPAAGEIGKRARAAAGAPRPEATPALG
jgi:hypothetical protein